MRAIIKDWKSGDFGFHWLDWLHAWASGCAYLHAGHWFLGATNPFTLRPFEERGQAVHQKLRDRYGLQSSGSRRWGQYEDVFEDPPPAHPEFY